MSKIYLSGPMTGLPELNFPLFNAEAARLRGLGFDVVNPAELNPDGASWGDCMRKDIVALMSCDTVATLPGGENSKGAQLEVLIGERLGMAVVKAQDLVRPPAILSTHRALALDREIDMPKLDSLADIPYANQTPEDWDPDYRKIWQELQVASRNKTQLGGFIRDLRGRLADALTEVADLAERLRIKDSLYEKECDGTRLLNDELNSTKQELLQAQRLTVHNGGSLRSFKARIVRLEGLLRRCLLSVREQHCEDDEADFDLPANLMTEIEASLGIGKKQDDPHGCNQCTHPECGRYNGPNKIECRAMSDGACARPAVEGKEYELPGGLSWDQAPSNAVALIGGKIDEQKPERQLFVWVSELGQQTMGVLAAPFDQRPTGSPQSAALDSPNSQWVVLARRPADHLNAPAPATQQ
ncbi:DUF4406 domain-containing protein [Pseudomonas capsici]|uniref:DUF4406 domain-containing protein n=1 Tax=Pseudomonas capsici TaxID=2810614 RepID=UPI0021F1EEF6|nr:DUF4406 domain-containing protein [Pseudomonas capsici]MCV4285043.1 DUF4406 domain-containing protein [Pseudomonas capsici]